MRGGKRQFGQPVREGFTQQINTLANKEDVSAMNSIDQIAMIEDLAAKITSNPTEHVSF